jgi:tetratricopeptide (TPR) repeat protein
MELARASAEPGESRRAPPSHHYFAFLSYSHDDSADADWLHQELEKFRVPRSLAGKLTANGVIPKRLSPIFRDRHEFAAGRDLTQEIRVALAASRCLIVLCSPASTKSKWTNTEIEVFKKAHPDGCVIAAIVAGDPLAKDDQACFPPALLQKYDRLGRPTGKRAEPLAADLRDSGDGRRTGLLKIVAGILGVGLDDLVQRDHLRRQRRLGIIAAASLGGMVVTSGLAVTAIEARDAARDQRRQAESLIGFMLGDLKDRLEPVGRLDVLDAVGTRALAYYEKQDKGGLSDEALAQRAKALTLLGEIAITKGDLDAALVRYKEAFGSTAEQVRRHPEDPERLWDHAQNVFYLGEIAYERGQLDEATARMREYKRLAEQMVALAPDRMKYRLEEVYADTNLGTMLMDGGHYRDALETYKGSLQIAEGLAAAEPTNKDYRTHVVQHLAWIADAYEDTGDLDRALASRQRELQLLSDLQRTDPRDTEVRRDTLTANRSIGRLIATRGNIEDGLEQTSEALAAGETLSRLEPDNAEWLRAVANTQFDMSEIQLAAGRLDDSAKTLQAACDIVKQTIKPAKPLTDWQSTSSVKCLLIQGRIALREAKAAQALSLATVALQQARAGPKANNRASLMMQSLLLRSDALKTLGREQEAVADAGRAIDSLPPGMELKPSEMAQVAALQLRLGKRGEAQKLTSRLAAMGYRRSEISSP